MKHFLSMLFFIRPTLWDCIPKTDSLVFRPARSDWHDMKRRKGMTNGDFKHGVLQA